MPMNKTQIEYAFRRIDEMLSARTQASIEKNTTPARVVDDAMRAELIRSGKVKLRPDVKSIRHYADVVDVFDFSKFSAPAKTDQKAIDKELRTYRVEAQQLKDNIMLGDAEAALAALGDFAKKCGVES